MHRALLGAHREGLVLLHCEVDFAFAVLADYQGNWCHEDAVHQVEVAFERGKELNGKRTGDDELIHRDSVKEHRACILR